MMLKKLENISHRLNWWAAVYISGGCTLAMMGLLVSDAILRNLFGIPVRHLIAISELLLVWVCLAAFAHGLITGVHVRVTILLNYMPRRLRLWCEILACLIGTVAFAFLTYYGAIYWWTSFITKESAMTAIRSPVWVSKPAVPLAAALMTFEFLIQLIRVLRVGRVVEIKEGAL